MSDVVIRAEGLGKKYLIGHEAEPGSYSTFRDAIARTFSRMRRSASDLVRGRPLIVGDEVEEFWALKDIDFEIRRGETVGIIGRNGAGKSTLLKVLSRITEPTEGRVTIEGRVASLLEVGTGFHPELSGRENIFLNGSILGMTRREIQAKFDEIVDFAGVDKFIDTPVKRYSSGMKVRLGFSVAAHLEPEILIVDEVLAVGDAEFQKRCLGKMEEVASEGRTVLFVSHNIAAVKALCTIGIVMEKGAAQEFRTIEEAISHYVDPMLATSGDLSRAGARRGNGLARFLRVSVVGAFGDPVIPSGSEAVLEFDIEAVDDLADPVNVAFSIRTPDGAPMALCSSAHFGKQFSLRKGSNKASCRLRSAQFIQGEYIVNISCSANEVFLDWVQDAAVLRIGNPANSDWKAFPHRDKSLVLLDQEWSSTCS